MVDFISGDLVEIHEVAWKSYLKEEGLREDRPPPGVRTVIRVTEQGVLLDYPLHFWSEKALCFAPDWHRMIQR